MGHTWENSSHNLMGHLEKWGTFRKMDHTWRIEPHLQKCVTFGKMGHNCKKVSHLEKGHKNGSHLQKWITLCKIRHLEKWVPLGIMSHTVKQVTLGEMGHRKMAHT